LFALVVVPDRRVIEARVRKWRLDVTEEHAHPVFGAQR
jgi:hypothetical protein